MTDLQPSENAAIGADTPSSLVFYNDNDAYCAQWLRNLIEAGHLPAGDVDGRSIVDVRPADLAGYEQCHFFAGIGGWPLAIRLAGYEGSVWTGSCPCQPFSAAGKQGGSADERHLWPRWFRLIRECRPDTIFGEQVAGAVGFGWIDRVFADLEAEGYACGAAILGAHSVGAPHIRQRLFWVADAGHTKRWALSVARQDGCHGANGGWQEAHGELGTCGEIRWVADAGQQRREGIGIRVQPRQSRQARPEALGSGAASGVGYPSGTGLQGQRSEHSEGSAGNGGFARPSVQARTSEWNGPTISIRCSDATRRGSAEPTIFPLAHGIPNRVGLLRGAGNAIVPQVAAEFVSAFLEIAAKSEERTTDE